GSGGDQLVSSAVGRTMIVEDRQLVELPAGGGGVFAGDTGLAKRIGFQADAAGDGIDRQIIQAIGAKLAGHSVEFLISGPWPFHESRSKEFADRGHIDAVKTRRQDRWASDADMDLPRP